MSTTHTTQDEYKQSQEWQKLETSLEEYMEQLNESNIDAILNKMITNVDILWGRDILIKYILCYKSQFGLSSNVICSLVKHLSYFIPDFSFRMTKQIIFTFVDSFQNNRIVETLELLQLIGDLFNYGIIAELVVLQVLQIVSKGTDQEDDTISIRGIFQLMLVCGKKLQQTNVKVHDGIFEKLSTTEINDDNVAEVWKQLLILKDSQYENTPALLIPQYKGRIKEPEPVMFIIAKELKEPDDQLGEFQFVSNLDDITKEWEELKRLIKQHPAITETNIESPHVEEPEVIHPETVTKSGTNETVKDMTNTADIEFKKEIYLILKSSLSGDEAAHKILKRRTPDDLKFNIVDIIIKSSIQEATYSKFYGIIAERLLNSHKAWKPAFNKIFKENYEQLDTFEPAQLRIIGKFWGHLFATDYIGFELFEIVKINAEESTPPSRIFIKFIFQELVADLSIEELKDRLNEEYIQPYVSGMFPSEDMENIRYSINYFTAIGLGVLTDKMREKLLELEEQQREEVEEQVEEEDEEEAQDTSEQKDINLQRGSSRYDGRGRNDRPQFESSDRERSVTPPRQRRNGQHDRSVTPSRNNSRYDQPHRYKDNIPQGYRNVQPQQRYRDHNIPQRYRNAQPQQRYRDNIPQQYINSSSQRNNKDHSPKRYRGNSSNTVSNSNPPPPKRSRYNN